MNVERRTKRKNIFFSVVPCFYYFFLLPFLIFFSFCFCSPYFHRLLLRVHSCHPATPTLSIQRQRCDPLLSSPRWKTVVRSECIAPHRCVYAVRYDAPAVVARSSLALWPVLPIFLHRDPRFLRRSNGFSWPPQPPQPHRHKFV